MLTKEDTLRLSALIRSMGLKEATSALGIGAQTMEAARHGGTMQVATADKIKAGLDRLDAAAAAVPQDRTGT